MAVPYSSEGAFIEDYRRLHGKYRAKVDRLLKRLIRIQRFHDKALPAKGKREKSDEGSNVRCSFCGCYQHDNFFVCSTDSLAYICDDCVKMCSQIIEEKKAQLEGKQPPDTDTEN